MGPGDRMDPATDAKLHNFSELEVPLEVYTFQVWYHPATVPLRGGHSRPALRSSSPPSLLQFNIPVSCPPKTRRAQDPKEWTPRTSTILKFLVCPVWMFSFQKVLVISERKQIGDGK